MATNRFNIGSKFQNTDIPSEADFKEIFDSFVHKDEDKADFQMVEGGTDNDHYVTPALLYTGLKNIGIITGNCYMPHKETFENSFSGTTLSLEKLPIQNSVKVFKNGQLLQEGQQGQAVQQYDYIVNYDTAVITFSDTVSDRNLEVDYWYKNLSPNPGSGSGTAIDFTSFLHTSGNETKNGLLTFNNTTPASTSGIILKNSGAGATATSLDVTNSGAGNGISLQNSSTGTGVKVSNAGAGVAVNVNSATGSTGDILQVAKNNVVQTKIDSEGNVTAPKFVTTGGTNLKFVKGDGSLDPTVYAVDSKVIHIEGNESKDGALNLTHNTAVQDVLTITKNNSANCLKLVQNSSSNATTSTFDTSTTNNNRKAISVQKIGHENAFITHDGNVTATSFTSYTAKADITDGFLTLGGSSSPTASQGYAKLYAKTDGTTDMYVMGSDGVEKKIGGVVDLSGKENTVAPGTNAQYYRGDKSWQTLDKTAVGLANVDNTSDLNKPVSTATQAVLDNVLHKTGFSTETKTGELVIDSGTAGISGLKLNRIVTTPSITTSSFTTGLNNPSGICDGGDGYYYVTNNGNSTISKINKTTGVLTNASFVTSITKPYGICKANDGNLYVAGGTNGTNGTNGTIYKITLAGVVTTFVTGLSYLRYLIQANDGNLYAVSQLGTIYKVTLAGTVTSLVTGLNNPQGIVQGIDNNLYVTIPSSMYKITLLGVSTLFATFSGMDGAICQTTTGDFYTVSYGGGWIIKITSLGVASIHKTISPLPNGILLGNDNYLYTTSDSADRIDKTNIISNDKVLKTDSTGLLVKTTYLEDVPYLKASDVDLSTYAKLDSPILTGSPTAPTAAVGTNTTQVATTAFVQANARPYKVYTAIVSQTAGGIPTAIVLENTLGGAVTWSKNQVGFFNMNSTGLFTLDKTVVLSSNGLNYEDASNYNVTWDADSTDTIRLYTSTAIEPKDDLLRKSLIEIRVYN
ncbi:hypothetical protein [uncultured Flavobacterium sp.]|uniref:virginiamycin B lyase family protein n=1 Tax=uncultured Flavobacterium sp. TaxID=165435 RepID=UPI00292EB23C|nr:hypothetical protein [uncultured Flavobacterium sp.]